uniref:Uncharacterized protein n=1 Tax=Kalanchoe fedtschenkoi TaxID=63787 RepID=A0A7N0UPN7_KALFE
MGCFLACFGCTKNRKRLKPARVSVIANDAPHRGLGSYQQLETASMKLDAKESSACHVAGPDSKKEKPTLGSVLRARKKVSFNLNVRTYELINSQDYSQQCDEGEKLEKEKVEVRNIEESTATAYPSNYRYKNFVDCEEEEDEVGYSDNDADEEGDHYDDCLEDCEDDDYKLDGDTGLAANNLALDHSTNHEAALVMNHHERFKNAHSVLSPVENTAQWRAVKVKASSAQPIQLCKENVTGDKSFHMSMQQEIRVDASLSNWIRGGNGQHNALNAPLMRTI